LAIQFPFVSHVRHVPYDRNANVLFEVNFVAFCVGSYRYKIVLLLCPIRLELGFAHPKTYGAATRASPMNSYAASATWNRILYVATRIAVLSELQVTVAVGVDWIVENVGVDVPACCLQPILGVDGSFAEIIKADPYWRVLLTTGLFVRE
jgi:hypothetical protein